MPIFFIINELSNLWFVKRNFYLILLEFQVLLVENVPSCLKVLAILTQYLTYPKKKSLLVEDTEDKLKHAYEIPMLSNKK